MGYLLGKKAAETLPENANVVLIEGPVSYTHLDVYKRQV